MSAVQFITSALQFGFMTYWLGIDVGTGGTRALLVDEAAASLAQQSSSILR